MEHRCSAHWRRCFDRTRALLRDWDRTGHASISLDLTCFLCARMWDFLSKHLEHADKAPRHESWKAGTYQRGPSQLVFVPIFGHHQDPLIDDALAVSGVQSRYSTPRTNFPKAPTVCGKRAQSSLEPHFQEEGVARLHSLRSG